MVLPPTARDEASMAIGHGAKSVLFWLRNEEAVHIPASRTFELIYNANYKQAQLHLEETSFYIWQNSTDYPPLLNVFWSKSSSARGTAFAPKYINSGRRL